MNVYIDVDICKGCGLCLYYCSKDVFALSGEPNRKGYTVAVVIDPMQCTGCGLCEISCPDMAIYVEKVDEKAA